MASGVRKSGQFCWINILTAEPAAARDFFTAVLGWSYREMPGMGHTIQVEGHDVGGLFDLSGPNTPPGTRPVIGVMVKVDSADATVERIAALGGTAKAPFDIMHAGRMAVCYDPNGAQFDIWESRSMQGTTVDARVPGAPTWFETLTNDSARATKFYVDLFGWTSTVMTSPAMEYTTFALDGIPAAGMLKITREMGDIPPHWGVYFTVRDVDETARLAAQHGGSVCIPPKDIPDIGRFCGLMSPQNVMFYAMSYLPGVA